MARNPIHLLWINEHVAPVGGCEGYIRDTAVLLREKNISSTLLYDVAGQRDTAWMKNFDRVFPHVDLERQIADIKPDLVYIHRLSGIQPIEILARCGVPAIRFFHDHKLFCLREHKYTPLGHRVCVKPIGLRCYPCLGFLTKSSNWPGVRLRRVSSLQREQRSNKKLDGFVVASRYMADHIAAHGFDSAKIHTIPLYSPIPKINLAIQREGDLLLFVGQFVRGKGLDVLLRALEKVKLPIRLAAAGTGRQEGEFRSLARGLGIESRVQFLGKINSEQLSEYYQRATCLVFPSRAPETFGLSGTEAMSYGLPVIASNVGGINQWLEHEKTGFLVPPSDERELAIAIDRVIGNPEIAQKFGQLALERYQSLYRPEVYIERLVGLFDTILKRKAKQA